MKTFISPPLILACLLVAHVCTGCATSEHFAVHLALKSNGSEKVHVGTADAQEVLKLVFNEVGRLGFTVHREPPWMSGTYPADAKIIDRFCVVNEHTLLSEHVLVVVRLSPEDGAVVVEFRNAFESETRSARRLRDAVTRSLSETSIYEVQTSKTRVRYFLPP